MAGLLRGEVRWADIETVESVVGHEQANRRPVLILSNDHFNESTRLVIAAMITSSSANRRYALPINSVQMPRPSWVLPSQIRTLSEQRLNELIGTMSEDELETVLLAVFRNMRPY